MKLIKSILLSVLALALFATAIHAAEVKPESLPAGQHMYVIERDMPGVGNLSADELKGASQKSCGVLKDLGPQITWLHSYVTGDKLYCVYLAPNEEMVREHAKRGGFPANKISEVKTIISPATAGQ
ncbi:MAG TPA: DUF4242 domain-containing protein [Candidatus Didemnitutus sp.]|nr:DUF4242 domain-containing protein [Candidatus Didemnitutus sp.]